MLYRFAKILMSVALRFFYRKMYVTGLEVIPPSGPAIIIANHPSSLMDAVLIGILVNRPVFFFTRGDVFVSRPVNYLLSMLRMIPVHGHQGNRNSVDINDASFRKASEILSAGGIVLFFPEGNSQPERKLMPLRKGIFRLAFQAAQSNHYKYNIPFIPAGINYGHPVDSNKDVLVNFGTPFFLNSYRKEYEANPAGTLLQMTKDGFNVLEKNVLHVADPGKFKLTRACLTIYRNNYYFFTNDWMQATGRRFVVEKEICNQINAADKEDLKGLQEQTTEYFETLKKYGLKDNALSPLFSFSRVTKLKLIGGIPFFLLGWILNALPVLTGKKIADTKVYRTDFYSWIFVITSVILYMIWLAILFAGFLITGWLYAAGVVVFTVLSGVLCWRYRQWWQNYRQYRIVKRLDRKQTDIVNNLRTLRSQLLVSITSRSSALPQLPGLIK